MGVFALFGFDTVTFNDVHYTGIKGLLVSIPMGIFLALMFTCFIWLFGILGLWVNSHLKGVTIVFTNVIETSGE